MTTNNCNYINIISKLKSFMKNGADKANKEKTEWVYIATTKLYSQKNIYKPGSTTHLKPAEDPYYYCWAMKCYNSKDVDYHIQKLLSDFKYKDNDELIVGINFSDLKDILTCIVDKHNSSVERINNFIKTRSDARSNKDEVPQHDYRYFLSEGEEEEDEEEDDEEEEEDEEDED